MFILGETSLYPIILLAGVLLSVVEIFLLPILGKKIKKFGFVGIDQHKLEKPKIPNGGPVLAVLIFIFLGLSFYLMKEVNLLYVLIVTTLFAIFGFFDDILKLGKYKKTLFTIVFGLLLLPFTSGSLFGMILSVVTIFFIASMFNTFAGLNGLETGSSLIITFFLFLYTIMVGMGNISLILIGMSLMLLSFLKYNKYPAKIFLGNTGTMLIGGLFASIAFFYNLYIILIPLLTLHIFDYLLKISSKGIFYTSFDVKPTKILKSGVLKPRKDHLSVIKLILNKKPMTERDTVRFIWILEFLIGMITFLSLTVRMKL